MLLRFFYCISAIRKTLNKKINDQFQIKIKQLIRTLT